MPNRQQRVLQIVPLAIADSEEHRHAPLQVIARREWRDLAAAIAALNAVIDARNAPSGTPPRSAP